LPGNKSVSCFLDQEYRSEQRGDGYYTPLFGMAQHSVACTDRLDVMLQAWGSECSSGSMVFARMH
jgi:hypothetical protein